MLRIVAIASLLFLTACSTLQPDLRRLYSLDDSNNSFQPPVIIVPGIVSSTLVDENDKEIWFGPLRKLLSSDYRDMALEMDPDTLNPKPSDIKAGRLPETVLTKDFYGPIFETLEDAGRYKLRQPGQAWNGRERRYYKFPYDWRQSNDVTARKLDAFIEQVRKDYGRPNMRVDLIGHSMGGLVIRYFLRYGTEDVLNDNELKPTQAGAAKANRVILLGAPNLGSLATFEELVKGYKLVFSRVPTEVLVTMPAIFQLLPHPINHWLIDINGDKLDEDLFDIATWKKFEWSIFAPEARKRIRKNHPEPGAADAQLALLERYMNKHLERARRFVWSLTVGMQEPQYQLINFGGDCALTPARVLMESVDGKAELRFTADEIKHPIKGVNYENLMSEPGDGRVTKPSMLAREFLDPAKARHRFSFFPQDYAFFLCQGHASLTNNINFQDNLLNALLERSTFNESMIMEMQPETEQETETGE